MCPLDDDVGERIQMLNLPCGVRLEVARSTCGGGTGARPWRGGVLLAKLLCSWASNGVGNDATLRDDSSLSAGFTDLSTPSVRALFHNKDVMELGAGAAGLPSMALAKLIRIENPATTMSTVPSSIVATDGVDEIVQVLETNIVRNRLERHVRVQHLNWNHLPPEIQSSADAIIFSDCVYNEEGAAALYNAISHLLRPGGIVLGVLPNFRVGLTDFETRMKGRGFVPIDVSIEILEKSADNDSNTPLTSSMADEIEGANPFLCAGGGNRNYRTILWKDRRDTL